MCQSSAQVRIHMHMKEQLTTYLKLEKEQQTK